MLVADLNLFLSYTWEIIKDWWWLPLPFALWKPFTFLYLFWRNELWVKKQRFVTLDIKIPKDNLKPIRAMEHVMVSIHGAIYQPPDFWEKWVDGQIQLGVSLEIASIGGETHFFIRTPAPYRDSVESAIYSQYPEAEMHEVDDYVKYVPQNIPNKEWDLFGSGYSMLRDDHYPIKTYPKFETEHEAKEEQKVDPIAYLLEAMSKVKPGEQLWIQIAASPLTANPSDHPNLVTWVKQGIALRDKMAKRVEPSGPSKTIVQESAELLIAGTIPGETVKEEKDPFPPEMRLTPGEREVVEALEIKMSKPIFDCYIRFIYLGKRDVWFKPNFRLALSFFKLYTTENLNAINAGGPTLTKIHKSWFLPINMVRPRRQYLRCRKLFRNYVKRLPPFFPKPGGTFKLNTEELASLFHFPSKGAAPAPGAPRIEVKRRGIPSDLPVE